MTFKPDATVRIPTEKGKEFFRYWLQILGPFHNLTKREIDVAVSFLWNRYKLSKVVSDPDLLEESAVNEATKKKVREECGITLAHFQVIMGKLRKSKIFDKGKLNPKYIPNIKINPDTGEEATSFQLLFLFDLKS